MKKNNLLPMREKCQHWSPSWTAFPRIQAEYGEIPRISPYPAPMREKTDQKNSEYGHFNAVYIGVPSNLSNIYDRAFSKISCWLLAVNHIETSVLESLFAKVTGLQLTTLLKKRLQDSCFSVNSGKFLIAAF